MNICGGSSLENYADPHKRIGFYNLDYDNIELNLDETRFEFIKELGEFHLKGTKELNDKIRENDDVEEKLKEEDEKINIFKDKIIDLDIKIANLEKVLLLDSKEQQYIHYLGQNEQKKL